MTSPSRPTSPRFGEFFAPLPLLFVALLVVNDYWAKARFHNEITGKLSDVAVCFFMPLFCSELLGICFGASARVRLWIGSVVTALLFTLLEIVPPVTQVALACLTWLGPMLGVTRHFGMTRDLTDLYCVGMVPLALLYGYRRLAPKRSAQ
jgi:hypothetical protein